jgi:hypothetical protein
MAFMGWGIKLLPTDRTEQVFDLIEKRLNELSKNKGITLSVPFVVINTVKLKQ